MKEEYEKIKSKYGLPEYDVLDREFNLSTIEKDDNIIKEITKKLVDKSEYFQGIIAEIIQPDSTIISISESESFEELERESMYEIFKRIQYYQRRYNLIELDYTDEKCAEFFNEHFTKWLEIKHAISEVLTRLTIYWKEEENSEYKENKEGAYFG